jgi:hypothetical protein
MSYPYISTDTEGVWCSTKSGARYGIKWDEVFRIGGYKLDAITQIDTIVELDFEYGEFVELNSEFPGFDTAISTFARYVPSLPDNWYSRIAQLRVGDKDVTVWQRAEIANDK